MCWKAGCASLDCRPARKWIGTAFIAAKEWRALPNNWPGDGGPGGGTDSGQPSASQGACGADERGAARPAGQSNAIGGDQRHGKREPFSGREVSAWVQPAVRPGGRQSPGRASSRAAELERSVELGRRARGARRLDGGVRGEAVSIGPAARGVELGAAEGDRADAAQRADAVGVSGAAPSVAGAARRGGAGGVATESEVAQAGENETGEGAGRESSVAPGWRGSREAVLERDQGRGAADARGLPAGDRASGRPPLRSGPPTDPDPRPGQPWKEPPTTKGTFSREL